MMVQPFSQQILVYRCILFVPYKTESLLVSPELPYRGPHPISLA